MEIIKLNHWFMKENELSISLTRFVVKINILKNDQTIYYQTYIKGEADKELTFNFYTIEDAISFTEQVVAKSIDTNEIIEKFYSMFENGTFMNPYQKSKRKYI